MSPARYLFSDRHEAGEALAQTLRRACLLQPLVLGIPRGGVPVAAVIANGLGGELDIVVARKLRAPDQPELALGAVAADGTTCWNADVLAALDLCPSRFAAECPALARDAAARASAWRSTLEPRSLRGRDVVVVDDGLATGATLRVALRSVARAHPARLVAAVPVGASDACHELRLEFPEFVCLHEPQPFTAVGAYYARFPQVEDEEVVRLLRTHASRFALKN